jgi:hypothetical protein
MRSVSLHPHKLRVEEAALEVHIGSTSSRLLLEQPEEGVDELVVQMPAHCHAAEVRLR